MLQVKRSNYGVCAQSFRSNAPFMYYVHNAAGGVLS